MIAIRQQRRQDVFTRRKATSFVAVLKRLKIISSVGDKTVQADRMWEKLLELALFVRSGGTHRKPTEILKSFIKKPEAPVKLTKEERTILTKVFTFLKSAYSNSAQLQDSRLATDQTHFYTMATALLHSDLLDRFDDGTLTSRLAKFAALIEKDVDNPTTALEKSIAKYRELSTEKTTDATRRKERQQELIKALDLL